LILFFIFKLNAFKFWFGISALVLTLVYGIYGYWNANNIRLKNIEVKIKSLPSAWQNKRIVQLSDAHLGLINSTAFTEKMVAKVNSAKPDLILITGDLFDGTSNTLEFISILNKLEATDGIYFVTGNHEVYLGAKQVLSSLKKSKIKVLDNQAVDLGGLQLVGISYPEFGESRGEGFLKNIIGNDLSPKILMYHSPTNVEQHGDSEHASIYFLPNSDFDAAKKAGVNLQLSGHTHEGQLFPYNLIAGYIYKRYNYGLMTEGDFNIYITSGVGTWGPPMRVGTDAEVPVIVLR